jgi:murein DD-endopeptidase MepM/ murein hydrolase activator NlpD
MASFTSAFGSGLTLRLLLASCLAGLLAGCADSERLSDPFSNPFGGDTDRTPTASIRAPTSPVQSHPLSPSGQWTNRPVASYATPASSSPHLGASGIAGWTAEGGTPIVMAQGESAEIISRRYGIPTEALLRTNGFSSSAQVRPGARLVIPTYNAALAASIGDYRRAPTEKLRFAKDHVGKFAKSESKAEEIAQMRAARRAKQEAKGVTLGKPEASLDKVDRMRVASVERAASEPKRSPIDTTPTSSLEPETAQTLAAGDATSPEFRWPARGRIIQAYGAGGNDGINIALPEGTSVKAAEAGIVAYAGNDLKGYGNLVLIRHPNGFVTAYANNGEIDVKRGETVKRGQVIAKSGESGNVASPQLHFELRKGSTPVDPTQYLAGL